MDKSIDGLATPLTQLKEEVLVCSFSEYVIHSQLTTNQLMCTCTNMYICVHVLCRPCMCMYRTDLEFTCLSGSVALPYLLYTSYTNSSHK